MLWPGYGGSRKPSSRLLFYDWNYIDILLYTTLPQYLKLIYILQNKEIYTANALILISKARLLLEQR